MSEKDDKEELPGVSPLEAIAEKRRADVEALAARLGDSPEGFAKELLRTEGLLVGADLTAAAAWDLQIRFEVLHGLGEILVAYPELKDDFRLTGVSAETPTADLSRIRDELSTESGLEEALRVIRRVSELKANTGKKLSDISNGTGRYKPPKK